MQPSKHAKRGSCLHYESPKTFTLRGFNCANCFDEKRLGWKNPPVDEEENQRGSQEVPQSQYQWVGEAFTAIGDRRGLQL